MILISHRGNIEGNSEEENKPSHILNAIKSGFECEIDVRHEDNKWFLGHNTAQYEVDLNFLLLPKLWLHAKTIFTLHELMKYNVNCFFHESDPCVLTSKGYIWTYPGYTLGKPGAFNNSICVKPELTPGMVEFNCVGICSDNITKYK